MDIGNNYIFDNSSLEHKGKSMKATRLWILLFFVALINQNHLLAQPQTGETGDNAVVQQQETSPPSTQPGSNEPSQNTPKPTTDKQIQEPKAQATPQKEAPGNPPEQVSANKQTDTPVSEQTKPVPSDSNKAQQPPIEKKSATKQTQEIKPAVQSGSQASPKKQAPPVQKKQTAAQPAPKPAIQATDEKPSQSQPKQQADDDTQAQPEGEAKAESGDAPGSGLKIKPGLTFGTMTRNGKTWTRFSFRPEISFGKLGVALDLELFMNEEQQFDSYGWNFDTFDNGMESILRKIYYVRWGQPGDGLFLKAGALENVTMGYGLIMNNYGNIAYYPDKKFVGFHGQINHLPILDLGLEVVLNNYQELFNGEGVIGTRAHFAPLSPLSLPLLSKIRLGGSIVSDLNQLAALPDRDGDNCPDEMDGSPTDNAFCKFNRDDEIFDLILAFSEKPESEISEFDDSLSREVKDAYKEGDQFTLLSFDAGLPIITSKFLNLSVYSEIAFQAFQESDDLFDGGWGLILPGVLANIGPLSGSLEYRIFNQPFHPGHFNGWYEAERAMVSQGEILTKEQKYWDENLEGVDQGIYGALGLDVKGLATVGGSYKVMFPEDGGHVQGYTGSASLGQSITNLIPKLSSGSIFWHKDKVGDDLNQDGDIGSSDGFFEPNIYTYYGYSVGIQMGANMIITVNRITTHTRNTEGKLTKATNLSFETAVSF